MALRRVADLVNRAAVDSGVLHALKNDPARLKKLLQLSSTHVAALRSAETVAHKPLGQSAGATPKLAAAADTLVLATAGTLLPPYGSGNFQTAAGGFVPIGTPTTGPSPAPSPQPPSPGVPPSPVQPPGQPSQPPAPPSSPVTYQPPPAMPALPPQLLPPQSGCCCCAAAITAVSSAVAQTSLAAIAAITAIAQIDSG